MNNDNWGKWSAVAEIVSSIAILITLVYLAVETEQNTAAIHSQTRQSMLDSEFAILQTLVDKPHIQQILESGTEGRTEQEITQAGGVLLMFFRSREIYWLQYRNGVIDEETWQVYRDVLVDNLDVSPFYMETWKFASQNNFHPGFIAEIEQRYADRGTNL